MKYEFTFKELLELIKSFNKWLIDKGNPDKSLETNLGYFLYEKFGD
jgi:hypothetical protein